MAVPVITPGGPLTKRGKEVQVFTATGVVVSWTTSGGTLSATGPAGATWTAPNKSGTYTVTATNADGEDVVTITVTGIVPFVPSRPLEVETKKKVLLFEPEIGDRQTSTKGAKKKTWQFTTANRRKVEFLELETFWDDNYPGGKVYFTHPYTSVESLYWIDSNLKEQWAFNNLVAYSFVLTEA